MEVGEDRAAEDLDMKPTRYHGQTPAAHRRTISSLDLLHWISLCLSGVVPEGSLFPCQTMPLKA